MAKSQPNILIKLKLLVTAILIIISFSQCSCIIKYTYNCPSKNYPVNSLIAIIGDSILQFNYNTCRSVVENLMNYKREYLPTAAEGGARLSGGSVITIIDQYRKLKSNGSTIKTVIMDGGGNDVLNECLDSMLPDCAPVVETVYNDLHLLFSEMQLDKVEKIIYIGPYHLISGTYSRFNRVVDLTYQLILTPLSQEFNIIVIDTRDRFEGKPELYFLDGVHPSEKGSMAIAELVFPYL